MGAAPLPDNEAKRLTALREYGILDTAPDPVYDAFAALAAQLCAVPVALVSLVDESRQWFKAQVGLSGITETARDIAFCAHAIGSVDILEVADARLDARFADNALVTSAPHVRFYAGMPLVDRAGNALGTLCTLDVVPRTLSEAQRHGLRTLGTSLAALIEARRGISAESLERLSLLSGALENASEPFMLLRRNAANDPATVMYVNRAFTELFGHSLTDLVGRSWAVLHGPLTDLVKLARVSATTALGEPASEMLHLYTSANIPRLVELRERTVDGSHDVVCLRDLTRMTATQEALGTTNLRLQSLLANNNDSVLTLDPDGSCVDANAAASDLFGYGREDLIGFGYLQMTDGGLFLERALFPKFLHDGRTVEFSTQYRHRDGRSRRVKCKAIPMVVRGTTVGAYVMSKDVTEAAHLEDVVAKGARRTHALCRISAAKGTSDAKRIESILELALEAFDMRYGYVGELAGETLRIVNAVGDSLVDAGTVLRLDETHVRATLACGDVRVTELSPEENDGWRSYISAPLTIDETLYGAIGFLSRRPVTFDEFDRDFMRLVASLISAAIERHRQQLQLDRLAHFDALTGLPNRRRFQHDLEAAVARAQRERRGFALHFIDLDGFKDVNDRFGHEVGDRVLAEVGRRLEGIRCGSDSAARLGGDEFVFVQSDIESTDDAESLGGRLVDALGEAYEIGTESFSLGASIGISIFPDDGHDASSLLRNADAALYRAKARGKNRAEIARA